MKFKKYYSSLSKQEKKLLADRLDTSVAYLSQLANGHRNPGGKILLNIEAASCGDISYRDFVKEECFTS